MRKLRLWTPNHSPGVKQLPKSRVRQSGPQAQQTFPTTAHAACLPLLVLCFPRDSTPMCFLANQGGEAESLCSPATFLEVNREQKHPCCFSLYLKRFLPLAHRGPWLRLMETHPWQKSPGDMKLFLARFSAFS